MSMGRDRKTAPDLDWRMGGLEGAGAGRRLKDPTGWWGSGWTFGWWRR